jgi:hypothetical protein
MALSAAGLTIRNSLNLSPILLRESSFVSAVNRSDDVDMVSPLTRVYAAAYLIIRETPILS